MYVRVRIEIFPLLKAEIKRGGGKEGLKFGLMSVGRGGRGADIIHQVM